MFLLDTNILIYYAAGDREVADFLESHKREVFYIPTIVVVEFLAYPKITALVADKFKQFINQTIILNLDLIIAEQASQLMRSYKLKLADAVVAASAIVSNSILVIRNTRDFKGIEELRLLAL